MIFCKRQRGTGPGLCHVILGGVQLFALGQHHLGRFLRIRGQIIHFPGKPVQPIQLLFRQVKLAVPMRLPKLFKRDRGSLFGAGVIPLFADDLLLYLKHHVRPEHIGLWVQGTVGIRQKVAHEDGGFIMMCGSGF